MRRAPPTQLRFTPVAGNRTRKIAAVDLSVGEPSAIKVTPTGVRPDPGLKCSTAPLFEPPRSASEWDGEVLEAEFGASVKRRNLNSLGKRRSLHVAATCTGDELLEVETDTRAHQIHIAGFQSTPCTRGDSVADDTNGLQTSFQSTPLHEGRPYCRGRVDIGGTKFQSTPFARGATSIGMTFSRASSWFQSTPLHEGRRPRRARGRGAKGVSIQAPARGATTRK
jgi:hypothetical protein